MRPTEILRGYLEAAQRLGVALRWGEPVTALERAADRRITAVVTPRDRTPAGLVVNAAGAWAAALAELAGVELPVVPLRRQVAITEPTEALPSTFPMTIWGRNIEDNSQLWFEVQGGEPTTVLTLFPKQSPVPVDDKGWAQFPTTLYVPAAGCYEIEFHWGSAASILSFSAGR